MDVIKVIKERTSYRGKYHETPVPKEDLALIIEAGLAAPSGCNKQTTSLIAVDDRKLLKRIRELMDTPIGGTAPAIICVLTQKVIAYRDKCFGVQDYSAAVENMLLAAVGLGYQSCWVEGHITDADNIGRRIADVLGVPKEYDLVCVLPIGRAKEEVKRADKRPAEQRAWFNGFKKEE